MTISVGNNTYQYYYPDDYSLKNNKPQNNNPKPKVKAQDTSGSGGESSALGLLLASEAIRLGSEKASKMLMRGKEYTTSENVLKVLQTSRRVAPYIPTALILANSLSKRLNKDNEETFIEKHAGKIGFAAYLPTIIEEGLASMRGILAAKKTLGGQNIKLGALKRNYFFAWMTYLLAGLGLGVASKLSVKTGIPMQ